MRLPDRGIDGVQRFRAARDPRLKLDDADAHRRVQRFAVPGRPGPTNRAAERMRDPLGMREWRVPQKYQERLDSAARHDEMARQLIYQCPRDEFDDGLARCGAQPVGENLEVIDVDLQKT